MNGNGQGVPGKMFPLFVVIPTDAGSPHFQVFGQWSSPGGVMLPRRQLPAQGLTPALICQMFAQLASAGVIQQEVEVDGEKSVAPLPAMRLMVVESTPPDPPASRICRPEDGGG